MKRYAIRYQYPGTVNNQPVGLVYAQDIGRISPGCWSYTKDPQEATLFTTYDAAWNEMQRRHWNQADVVAVEYTG